MAIDLAQFHEVFFEESIEGLDIMESSLMELDPNNIDEETINAIFRCAHSIKGGSATFGFSSIAEFTHVLETLLDQVRSGDRGLSTDNINLLLQSVDCMREMLGLLQSGDDGNTEIAEELKIKFTQILDGEDNSSGNDKNAESKSSVIEKGHAEDKPSGSKRWYISFQPDEGLFLTGNDPLRNIIALCDLGSAQVECFSESLPRLLEINCEHSYLRWNIVLDTAVSLEQIQEIFEWIEDDCILSISDVPDDSFNESLEVPSSENKWLIHFVPGADVLRGGNDPAKIFRTLKEMGQLKVWPNASALPILHTMDSETCYLSWELEFSSLEATIKDIHEVFEWVSDESEVVISEVESFAAQETKSSSVVDAESSESMQGKISDSASLPQDAPVKKPAVSNLVKQTGDASTKKSNAESSTIRVGIDKVDSLINMVGELVITQSMLGELGNEFDLERLPKLIEGLSQLEQNTRELQENVMKIRMMPISFAFSRFPRMVRDLGQTLGKSVNLEMRGETTELDKTVMEKIGDPLVHLVRNAVDHGIETPAERTAKGKDPSGLIELNAFHQSGNVVIEISDDGKGLDRDKILEKAIDKGLVTNVDASNMSDAHVFDLIFQPGFSTAQTVSDVSGRGVGMDVVKRNIQALNGVVEIRSIKGQGSTITIKLPLTLAILDGQLVRVGNNTYVFPLVSIIESMQCKKELINKVAGGCDVFKLREDYVPIIELHRAFTVVPESFDLEESLLVVVESSGEKVGIVVDELLGQQQVVIKSLEHNYRRVEGVSGATILGDGTVALILDITGIINLSGAQIGLSAQKLGDVVGLHDINTNQSPGLDLAAH